MEALQAPADWRDLFGSEVSTESRKLSVKVFCNGCISSKYDYFSHLLGCWYNKYFYINFVIVQQTVGSCKFTGVLLLSMNLQTELTVILNAVALLFVYYTSKRADSTLKTPKEHHHKVHCAICCEIT